MASSGAVKIGSIFGIDIELHWIFIILTLFFFVDPYFGFLWVLLFICVLIHELAHSVTAIRNGIRVKKIILLPFGGASIIENIEIDPRIEFNISIVGPLMSLLLGGIFGLLAIFAPIGLVAYTLQELFVLNIFLGVLNLLPAFPMDGGRVFRSYMRRTHDMYSATMITAKVSKILLALIIIGTVIFAVFWTGYSLLRREYVFVIDLIVVVYLYGGVKAEEESIVVRRNTSGLTISGAISRNYAFVERESSVRSLYRLVKSSKSHIIITKTEKGYAVVDLSKVQKARPDASIETISVQIPQLQKRSNAADALFKMEGEEILIAVVLNRGKLIGIVTAQQLRTLISLHMLNRKDRKDFKP